MMGFRPRKVNLLQVEKTRKARSSYRRLLNASQWRARYYALGVWYRLRAARSKANEYRRWAVFTVID